ncbi:MAG: ROK family protein [Paenibacillaceae bacterium]|nr:ROK family protein [Paenibacillaceae bacterium]
MRLGAIEAGGTKMVCGIGDETGRIEERASFPTTTPEETVAAMLGFFRGKAIEALGIGSFGPVELNRNSPAYGSITTTPKLAWANYNLLQAMQRELGVPVGFDTDVNAAALGEATFGAAAGLDSCVYVTIGTGIGAGVVAEGKLLHGLLHPEMGHILVKRHPEDRYEGKCPYHADCLEGMAAGPAIEARWGRKGAELADDARVWEMEAYYLAQAVVNLVLILSPKKIILGGGVMHQRHMFPLVRQITLDMLKGYVQRDEITSGIDSYIVPPGLGDNAGLVGSLLLAKGAAQ